MTLTLKSRKVGDITFIETEVLGAKVTLSKTLTELLKKEKKLAKEITTDARMILVATTKVNNGKTWTNLFLTVKKEAKPAEENGTDDDLPF